MYFLNVFYLKYTQSKLTCSSVPRQLCSNFCALFFILDILKALKLERQNVNFAIFTLHGRHNFSFTQELLFKDSQCCLHNVQHRAKQVYILPPIIFLMHMNKPKERVKKIIKDCYCPLHEFYKKKTVVIVIIKSDVPQWV